MYNRNIILLLLFFVANIAAYGQTQEFTSQPTRGQYSLVAYLGGGAGYFLSNEGNPGYLHPVRSKLGQAATLRVLWFPNHLLKAGLETGYCTFYSYKLTDSTGKEGKLSFNAIPILLEWSMSVTKHFNIFAGPGVYLLNTKLDYQGKSTATKISMGWVAAASYIVPLTKNTGLGAEAKWLYAAETSNGSLYLQLQYVWKFLKW